MLISFEGCEGSGKTTQIRRLLAALRIKGHRVVGYREPGTTKMGDRVREILMNGDVSNPIAETLLFLAARAEFVTTMVQPMLEDGYIVLLDRFTDSTLVYQGYARELETGDMRYLRTLCRYASQGFTPDITFWLDVSPEDGLARVTNRGILETTVFDKRSLEFHARVYHGYETLYTEDKTKRWHKIGGYRAADLIANEISEIVSERLKECQ